MPDSPAQAEIPKFEFELWPTSDDKVYRVVRGGRSALKAIDGPQDWMYESPRYGIIDEAILRQLLQEANIGIPADNIVKGYLRICQNTAQALLNKYQSWWTHIEDILDFYEAVRGQSNQLIDAFIQKDPKLEAFRLPPISNQDRHIMQQMARVALKGALTKMKEKI